MHIIYVDDEALAITRFKLTIEQLEDGDSIQTFQNPLDALRYVQEHTVDVAFLDVEMPQMTGLELAVKLREADRNIRIIFVTAYNQYALDAFEVDALGYLMKPYSREKLANELQKAKRQKKVAEHAVFIQTIPTFDVFIDGEVLKISRPKVKELLAFLVDRNGSTVTMGDAVCALWEDRPDDDATKALYRMTAKRLKDLLSENKIDFILDTGNNQRALKTDEFTCDYIEILKGNKEYIKKYHGEYMREYSWAEETNARLSDMLDIF